MSDTLPVVEWAELSVAERAQEAWAAKAELDGRSAIASFRSQAMRKLKLRQDEYEISPDHFDDEVIAPTRMAAFVDGITLCLTSDRELAVLAWECAEGGCSEQARLPVSDYASLGRAIEIGQKEAEDRPHCRAHKKKGERL